MNLQMKQEEFSNCKCQNCGHFARVEAFNPTIVDLEDSNVPTVKLTIENPSDEISIQTINYNCPICNSPYVEPFFGTELN